jgi:hypothetical protein
LSAGGLDAIPHSQLFADGTVAARMAAQRLPVGAEDVGVHDAEAALADVVLWRSPGTKLMAVFAD